MGAIKALPNTLQNTPKYRELMQKTGDLNSELVVPEELDMTETEASIEVNLAQVKFKIHPQVFDKGNKFFNINWLNRPMSRNTNATKTFLLKTGNMTSDEQQISISQDLRKTPISSLDLAFNSVI